MEAVETSVAKQRLDVPVCYEKLLALYRQLRPWKVLFASHNPTDRKQHILLIDEHGDRIKQLAKSIREYADDCLAFVESTVHLGPFRRIKSSEIANDEIRGKFFKLRWESAMVAPFCE